ncbi:CsbD family protein [soil metagenome]
MDSDRVEGPLKEASGKVKEEWGDLTDDTSTEVEGKKDQVEGKVQNEWGEAKDRADDNR